MEAVKALPLLSIEDYLKQEHDGHVRHEFVGGVVHAMAGASEEHNAIAGNLHAALHAHLRGKPCRVFMVDLKVRLRILETDVFYYPDLMVVCDPSDNDRYFKRNPRALIEVLSPETEHTDRREKFLNYTQIESLEEYVLVAQDRMQITVFRRENNWAPVVLTQATEVFELESLRLRLSVSSVYESVKLPRRG